MSDNGIDQLIHFFQWAAEEKALLPNAEDSYQKSVILQAAASIILFEATTKKIIKDKLTGVATGTDAAKKFIDTISAIAHEMLRFYHSDEYKVFKKEVNYAATILFERNQQGLEFLAGLTDGELAPFIQEELEEMESDPELKNLSFQDIILDEKHTLLNQLIQRAEQRKGDTPRRTLPPLEIILLPLAKASNVPFELTAAEIAAANELGKTFELDTGKKGKPAYTSLKVDFEKFNYTKELTDYDQSVFITVGNLFHTGHRVISATQIYKIMNEGTNPTAEQVQRIKDSLEKMEKTYITIDNAHETKVYKKYKLYQRYRERLLPIGFLDEYTPKGGWTYSIRITQEPLLFEFSRLRNQLSGMPLKAYTAAISLTERGASLENYLRLRIAPMRRPKNKLSKRILFSSIHERIYGKAPIDRKEKSRLREKAIRILDKYEATGWIAGYTLEKDGITILLKKDKKNSQNE